MKLTLFVDDKILYIENPIDFTKTNKQTTTKTCVELIKKFSKFAGYNINIQKSFVFLYCDKLSEREIKKSIKIYEIKKIPFIITSKTIKHL